jgi:ABC-type lipoprotein release transport system permease subunit
MSCGKPVVHGVIAGMWLVVPTAAGLRESVRGSPIRLDNSEPLLYAIALLLAAAATVAMLGPAPRGANSDPLEALRYE